MSAVFTQFSISTTATEITNGDADVTTGSSGGTVLKNFGLEVIWLGSSSANASSSAGFPLDPGEKVEIFWPQSASMQIWAATSANTSALAVIQP